MQKSFLFALFVDLVCADVELKLNDGYDKTKEPIVNKNGKFPVQVFVRPLSVAEVSTKSMDFSVDLGIQVKWEEPRVTVSNHGAFKIKESRAAQIWTPALYFAECKDCTSLLLNPEKHSFTYDPSKRQVSTKFRAVHTFICYFNMSSYPFDIQECHAKFAYYYGDKIHVTFQYETSEMKVEHITMPPEFALDGVSITECHVALRKELHPCGSYDFKIHRVRTRPILIIFVPSMLLVMISWISFWLDVQAAAPRVALGLTVMLTLITHFNAAQRDLPAVSTIMALDIWMFMCICTVFSALIEFAVVHFFNRKSDGNVVIMRGRDVRKELNCWDKLGKIKDRLSPKPNTKRIDRMARLVFPVVFFGFNVFFWIRYCS